jgi:hypothetical protein
MKCFGTYEGKFEKKLFHKMPKGTAKLTKYSVKFFTKLLYFFLDETLCEQI